MLRRLGLRLLPSRHRRQHPSKPINSQQSREKNSRRCKNSSGAGWRTTRPERYANEYLVTSTILHHMHPVDGTKNLVAVSEWHGELFGHGDALPRKRRLRFETLPLSAVQSAGRGSGQIDVHETIKLLGDPSTAREEDCWVCGVHA